MEQTVSFLTEIISIILEYALCSSLFSDHKTHFKNVILIEQPSAAPTPVSRNIFLVCSKFGALNSALVIKCRAEID